MSTVGSYEARTHLSRLLSEVERGDTVMITKHGHPIARIVPVGNAGPQDADQLVHAMREARRGRRLDAQVRDLVDEGRS